MALAAGIGWAGPFEHLVQDAWSTASRLFPGLLLEAFDAGATALTLFRFARRDVTA